MQKAFADIVERLDKASDYYECEEQGREHVQMVDLSEAIEIVNQVAEEYEDKVVGIGAYQQVAWERDIAISQLKELGYEFGEKIREEEVCEWKPARKIDGIIMYGTSCYVEFEERLVRKYKYCPYCGKKINVIGG